MSRPEQKLRTSYPTPYTRGVNQLTPAALQPLDPRRLSIAERVGRRIDYTLSPEKRAATTLSAEERGRRILMGRITLGIATIVGTGTLLGLLGVAQDAHESIQKRSDCQEFVYTDFASDPATATERLVDGIHANSDTTRGIFENFSTGQTVELCGSAKYLGQQTAEAKTFLDTPPATTTTMPR